MHSELALNSGVTIHLKALNQFHTYEGLLEGVPTRRLNKATIESAMELPKNLWNCKAHLIEPVETPIDMGRPYPFGVPARIPPITCLGLWCTRGYARDGEFGCMQLAVVWHQEQFAFPIDESILRQIREIDWERAGEFYEY